MSNEGLLCNAKAPVIRPNLAQRYNQGYTNGIVKTAVSIPDPIFEAAEHVSKRLGLSRSRFYALAIEQLIERQQGRGIQEVLDELYATKDSHLDETLAAMQSASIRGNRKSW